MKASRVRIVVNSPSANGLVATQGTEVWVGDTKLKGVARIELVAVPDDVWRARIDVLIDPPAELSALCVVHAPSLWTRFSRWARAARGGL